VAKTGSVSDDRAFVHEGVGVGTFARNVEDDGSAGGAA